MTGSWGPFEILTAFFFFFPNKFDSTTQDFWLYLQIRSQHANFLGECEKLLNITQNANKLMTIMKKKTHIRSKINKTLNGLKNTINTSVENTSEKELLNGSYMILGSNLADNT